MSLEYFFASAGNSSGLATAWATHLASLIGLFDGDQSHLDAGAEFALIGFVDLLLRDCKLRLG